ncbi:calcium/sodium antiporter [Eubacterium xylanophilum]|uniref:calcium/sodium antiporter n=1 Tax=Eubacterium xylanophilum TaxID=39497 RepID=UPI00047BDAE3|nr:calcium/sodium antiporter [Eubacterium xylanophilum]
MTLELLKSIGILLLGFVFLIKGADIFVEGSSNVAKMMKIPSLIIGLTIVSLGTSLPELAVSISASLEGKNSLAISNITGSNIFNLLVVCGFAAILVPLKVSEESIKRDIPICIGTAVLLAVLGAIGWEVGRVDGIILLVLAVVFIIMMIRSAQKARKNSGDDDDGNTPTRPLWLSLIFIIVGVAGVKFGGDFVVSSATTIALTFGMSETLVGLTICAIGTSLPELVTSAVAAKKDEVDMAIGNAVGSCIFNILLIIGISSTISPLTFQRDNLFDLILLAIVSIFMFIFSATKRTLERKEGIILVVFYIIFAVYIIVR